MEKKLEKCTLYIAGKAMALLSDEIDSLHERKNKIQSMYDILLMKYDGKIDRESIFLLILFDLLHEHSMHLNHESKLINEINYLISNFDSLLQK